MHEPHQLHSLSAYTAPNSGLGPLAANMFVLEGAVWSISFAGRTVRLPDAKGLRD